MTASIETAFICAPSRAHEKIFGRPLLERLMLLCSRNGVRRFIVEAPPSERENLDLALGSFRANPQVTIVNSFAEGGPWRDELNPSAPCLAFHGNLVMAQSQLRRTLADFNADSSRKLRVVSTDSDHGGTIEVGPLSAVLAAEGDSASAVIAAAAGHLPFALNGRPEDRAEAELRLARAVRAESFDKDALMARIFDRRLSWRISYRLANTGITPNQVTLTNTALGGFCALLFATTSYWFHLLAAILFLISVTIDGVDGELARLKMVESEAGARLDVFTDNAVHVAIFIGLMVGCYRTSASPAYFYLLGILMAGFGFAAFTVNRALSLNGKDAERWIIQVERITGRDFAYLLVVLAFFDWLPLFAWGAAFGTWLFAICLWWATKRRLNGIAPA